MSEFEEQLKQERLAQQEAQEGNPNEYKDADGTVYEWDASKNAWFPKIDEDFIAKYQMNYGVTESSADQGTSESQPQSDTQQQYSQEEYDKYWKDYYAYYYGQQAPEDGDQEVDQNATTEASGTKVDVISKAAVGSKEEKQMAGDPDNHYDHYFSQYYDENYVPNTNETTDNIKNPEVDKTDEDGNEGEKKPAKAGEKRKPQPEAGWVDIEDDKNTNVYVSGLPLDITDDEFMEFMTKCGLVMPDLQTKVPKIKLYKDENNEPKGDGRCCYLKVESVNLALQILDGSDLRGHTVHVERAKFTMKGNFDPKKRRKKMSAKEKKKLLQQQQKLLDWKPEDDDTKKRWEKVAVLKHMFEPKEFEDDPLLINELREDVREECSKYGEIKKVVLYDRHPDGVMTVHFKEFEFAEACVAALNGRWFAKKQISAEIWDGKTKYEVEESAAERDERLKKWENFLESEEKKSQSQSGEGASMPGVPTGTETPTESSASESHHPETQTLPETHSQLSGASEAT